MSLVSSRWDLELSNFTAVPTELSTIGRPWGVWPLCGNDEERLENRRALRTLLRRDHAGKLCTPYLEFRRNEPDHTKLDFAKGFTESASSSWGYWCRFSHPWPCSDNRVETNQKCVQCRVEHPNVFFAISGRKNPGKGVRSCIGWTAKINICPHMSWAWKDAQKHLKKFTERPGDRGMNLLTGRCPCAEPPSASNGKSQPQVVDPRFSDDLTKLLVSSRTLIFKLNPDTPMSHEQLRAWTSSPSNQQALKGILCPHVRLDDGQLLLPFAQNQCACFDHPETMVAEGHMSMMEHDH